MSGNDTGPYDLLDADNISVTFEPVTDWAANFTRVTQRSKHHGLDDQCTTVLFIFYGIIIGFLCLMGLAGNTLSMIVLQKDYSNRVAAFLLQCLALADSFVLFICLFVLVIFVGWIPYINPYSANAALIKPYLKVYVEPLAYIAQSLAIWTTVLLAVNRYIAVCCPFIAYKLCTMKKAIIQVGTVVFVSVTFNIPRFFQFRITTRNHRLSYAPTSIGEKTLFGIVYTNALYTVLVLLLPLILLLVLNTRIIKEMRILKKRHSIPSGADNSEGRGETNITIVMVIIIIVFLICHTPDRVLQVVKNWNTQRQCGDIFFHVSNVCNLLIIFNSSTNFFIYYFIRKRFRRILLELLCRWTRRQKKRRSRFPSLMRPSMQSNCTMNTAI